MHQDIYGLSIRDIGEAKSTIEEIFGVKMELHDSLYEGVYYEKSLPNGFHLNLYSNFNDFDEAWREEKYKELPTLLYIDGVGDKSELESKLTQSSLGGRLLKRK